MTEYIIPPNAKAADELWAYMSEDSEGKHGIVACIIPGLGLTPMVTLSEKVALLRRAEAIKCQKEIGVKIVLAKFRLESTIPI
jgi:hypothetical protein